LLKISIGTTSRRRVAGFRLAHLMAGGWSALLSLGVLLLVDYKTA